MIQLSRVVFSHAGTESIPVHAVKQNIELLMNGLIASSASKTLRDPKSAEKEKKNASLRLGSGHAQAENLQQGQVVFCWICILNRRFFSAAGGGIVMGANCPHSLHAASRGRRPVPG
jgi:hypothetical protein